MGSTRVKEKREIRKKEITIAVLISLILFLTESGWSATTPGLSRRGPVPYKPQWVSVVKKGKLFQYKRKEFSSPRVWRDRIYVGSDAGLLYCLKKKGGRKVWRFKTEGSINAAPAFWERGEGTSLFIGDDKGIFYALSADKGQFLWRQDFESEIVAPPAIGKDLIFATTLEGNVVAMKPSNGQIVWKKEFPHPGPLFQMTIHGHSAPVLEEGGGWASLLFVGFSDGALRALQTTDGKLVWEKNLGEGENGFYDIDGGPIVEGNRIYVATFEGAVHALSKGKGDVLWRQRIGSGVRFVSEGERLYVSGSDGYLYALSKKDGSIIWNTKVGEGALTAPAIFRDVVSVGLSGSTINFLRASDGKILARRFARKGISSDPLVFLDGDVGRILYLSNGGRLYSLKLIQYKK